MITLCYISLLRHNDLILVKKVIASDCYHSGNVRTVLAADSDRFWGPFSSNSYYSGNTGKKVIASESY